jgi:hypothetical protein
MKAPTLAEIREWPATVDVTAAARALGIAPSTAYEWLKLGQFPVRVISVRGRHRVVTSSLLVWLDALNGDGTGEPPRHKSDAELRREIEAMVSEYRAGLLKQFGLGRDTEAARSSA